jgi:hypothetical protein
MTISEQRVLDMLMNVHEDINYNLGFILTVIKDNTTDDNTHKFLTLLIKRMGQ